MTAWIKKIAIGEKTLVVAVPAVGFVGEGVGCVWSAFVMAMDLDGVSTLSWSA